MNVAAMQRLIAELRNSGIADEAVLAAIAAVDRERFVSSPFVERAWENTALPIAFSQTYGHPHPVKWATATHYGADVARRILAMDMPRNILVNVNFPDVVATSVKGIRVTRQGVRGFGGHIVERTDPRGGNYYWIGYTPGEHEMDDESDLAAVRGGYISVTPLHLDLTHEAMRRRLRAEFEAAPVEAG